MRIAVCDDDNRSISACVERLEKLGETYDCYAQIDTFQTGEMLLYALEDGKYYDLIYMDIGLPGLDGMTVVQKIRALELQSEIIFLTAREEQWHGAFEVDALHFLVKGRTEEQYFESAFVRAVKKIEKKTCERIVFTCANEFRNIRIMDISYFEVNRNIVTVYYSGHHTFEFYTPLSKLQQSLEKYHFVKSHHSYLVSLQHVVSIKNNDLVMSNGKTVPVSRTYKKKLVDALNKRSADSGGK